MSHEERKTLERWVRMPTASQRLVLRSRIVLMLADGCPAREVARRLGVSRRPLRCGAGGTRRRDATRSRAIALAGGENHP
jgi:hypothetical protein